MAKNSRITVTKGKQQPLVVNDIRVQSVNRSNKNVNEWRNAHKAAESIHTPNRTRLYDLYEDVILDGHLTGLLSKRINSVLNKELEYLDSSGKRITELDGLIHSMPFRQLVTLILESQFWGISGAEFIPGAELTIAAIPRKHIKPEFGIISYEQSSYTEGIPYADVSNLWIIGEPTNLGLLLQCAPYVLYKKDNMADWANYIELFGQPMRIVKYSAHDEQTKIELKQVLDEAGSALALMIPKEADFEMKDGKQSNGDGQLQERFKDSLNQEMSLVVLGNTETSTNGKTGSQAKSVVHQKQQNEITQSDLWLVTSYLNSPHFQRILQSYGYKVTNGGRFAFTKEIDVAALKERMDIDKELATLIPMSDDYFYENYGVPKPDNYNELKKAQSEKPKPTKPGKSAKSDPEDDTDTDDLKDNLWRKFISFFA
jgi:hypothetical protein